MIYPIVRWLNGFRWSSAKQTKRPALHFFVRGRFLRILPVTTLGSDRRRTLAMILSGVTRFEFSSTYLSGRIPRPVQRLLV